MSEYQLISDYKQIETYRKSFMELAKQVFEIDLKEWYDKGFWGDNYICYSYVDGNQVIANASINKMVLETVVNHMISEETELVHFYFVPDSDNKNIQSASITETDDTLFVRPLVIDGAKHFQFPLTSHV